MNFIILMAFFGVQSLVQAEEAGQENTITWDSRYIPATKEYQTTKASGIKRLETVLGCKITSSGDVDGKIEVKSPNCVAPTPIEEIFAEDVENCPENYTHFSFANYVVDYFPAGICVKDKTGAAYNVDTHRWGANPDILQSPTYQSIGIRPRIYYKLSRAGFGESRAINIQLTTQVIKGRIKTLSLSQFLNEFRKHPIIAESRDQNIAVIGKNFDPEEAIGVALVIPCEKFLEGVNDYTVAYFDQGGKMHGDIGKSFSVEKFANGNCVLGFSH